MIAVARERSRLVPLKGKPTSNPTPVANAAVIEIPPVITVDVIRPVSTVPVIVCLIILYPPQDNFVVVFIKYFKIQMRLMYV